MLKIEPILAAQEQEVDAIARDVAKLGSAVKAWRKACVQGSLATRAKSAAQATELAVKVRQQIEAASESWAFDARAYLAEDWIQELVEAAGEAEIRAFRDEDVCILPPLVVSARPTQESLFLGKERLKFLRPRAVVKELQSRLAKSRDSANQEFLDSIYRTWQRRKETSAQLVRFREVYETFSLAPGWKKENSRAVFAQQIYSLHSSGLTTTRDSTAFNLQEPSSKVSESDIFEVRAKDGRRIRYYGISFAGGPK